MRAIHSKLKAKLRAGETKERCGIVLKSGRVLEFDNAHPDPERGFVIPVRHLIKYEKTLAATWHTHPNGSPFLSEDDYNGFSQWPDLLHHIVAPDRVTTYEVVDGMVLEVEHAPD